MLITNAMKAHCRLTTSQQFPRDEAWY